MRIDILTIFPRFFDEFLSHGMVRRARKQNQLAVHVMDLRGTAEDRHRTVDDRPYGGGPGMVLKPEPVFRALDLLGFEAGGKPEEGTDLVLLCPQGQRLDQECLEGCAAQERLVMLCGRYEGYDERIIEAYPWRRLSIGDFVLSGGEVPAMVLVEGISRLLPGVLGDEESARRDSFGEWSGRNGLDHPHWTRPLNYRGREVPEVLLSGDHGLIESWRREGSRSASEPREGNPGGEHREMERPER